MATADGFEDIEAADEDRIGDPELTVGGLQDVARLEVRAAPETEASCAIGDEIADATPQIDHVRVVGEVGARPPERNRAGSGSDGESGGELTCSVFGRRAEPLHDDDVPLAAEGNDFVDADEESVRRSLEACFGEETEGRVDLGPPSVCGRATAQTALACVPAYRATRMKRATWRLVRLSLGRPVEPT